MLTIATRTFPLLLGIGLLLVGIGLQGTLLALRANVEGFALTVIGVMMSAYFMGFIVGTFLCPKLIRSVGHIRAFSAFAAITAATAIAHGMVIDPWLWTALRIVTGTAMVGLYMVVESWLITMAPSEQRGRFLAVYTIITLLAMALGQYLILVDDIGGYRLFSLTALLVALAVVPIALTRILQPAAVIAPPLSLKHLHRISPLGVSGALTSGIINGAFWGLGALFARRIGMEDAGIALFMSLTIIGGALLQWPIGHLSDHYDRRHMLVWISFVTAAVATGAFFSVEISHSLLIAIAVVYGGLAFSLYGISVAHVNDHLDAAHILEASRALLLIYGAGAVIGPTIASYFMQQVGPGSLMLFLAASLLLLGLLGLYRLRVGRTISTEEQMEFAPMVRTSPVALEMDPRLDEGEGGPGTVNQ
ncbi:MAG: MFS transporter [Gammaproteobacteria bacterium]|nr:MFS transporter [Gammaproteobacteria bacterium]MCW8840018.1 MFS transporter [Gammaproteobacteria bacterium]MCW8928141.1 MFS transporter [Gammaproteobacteria bacterium]MCW8957993.1 MFS transporter [Gammaproteobacteria bacterium]MCW8972961.1 MFS transporter [Gammaproteobacteria bacterium]